MTSITEVQARWLGHELYVDVAITVDAAIPLLEAKAVVAAVRAELVAHLASLRSVNVTFEPSSVAATRAAGAQASHGGHHAPDPFRFESNLAAGTLQIVDTIGGERTRLVLRQNVRDLSATVSISRAGGAVESLPLERGPGLEGVMESAKAPAEPHEFRAILNLVLGDRHEELPFEMFEPEGHAH